VHGKELEIARRATLLTVTKAQSMRGRSRHGEWVRHEMSKPVIGLVGRGGHHMGTQGWAPHTAHVCGGGCSCEQGRFT
jgi:hypothetical protein